MILIVDDDRSVRLSISLALRRAGFEVTEASTEAEAIAAVRSGTVELAVFDMNLRLSTTGRDGIELLRKARVLQPELPVILITAWGSIPLAVEGMKFGAIDFMTKPWSNADLVAKIRKALAPRQPDDVPTLDEVERRSVAEALERAEGNISRAAAELGISRQSLYRRMQKYGL